jgi:hypothetical protein
MRGRTALYGPRHLLQLVAVKRRQAEGMRLAEIQAELAGAPDELLESIAEVPLDKPLDEQPMVESRTRFWAQRPASVPSLVGALQFDGGVTLLLPGTPSTDDIAAITAAAQPLMETLAARGLLTSEESRS